MTRHSASLSEVWRPLRSRFRHTGQASLARRVSQAISGAEKRASASDRWDSTSSGNALDHCVGTISIYFHVPWRIGFRARWGL